MTQDREILNSLVKRINNSKPIPEDFQKVIDDNFWELCDKTEIMTKEDKELLIKDLCARLPYGTMLETPVPFMSSTETEVLTCVDKDHVNDMGWLVTDVKPYLFPLSSMTEEQKKELFDLSEQEGLDKGSKDTEKMKIFYKGLDWINAHHFDYRGLIEKGLAIDATNLNIY